MVFVLSLSLSQALIVSQLDGGLSAPYTATFVPLHIAILSLFPTTLTRHPANPWWFGIKKNFIEFILELCPIFKEYLNVSWGKDGEDSENPEPVKIKIKGDKKVTTFIVLENKDYLYEDIMTPD